MTNNRKRRKRSDYGPDLPVWKDYNIGHWRGFQKAMRLRRCNECGYEAMFRGTAHKVWNNEQKRSIYCGTMKLVREPVIYKLRVSEEEE